MTDTPEATAAIRRDAAIGAALARAGGGLRTASLLVGVLGLAAAGSAAAVEPGLAGAVAALVALGELALLGLGQWLGLRLALDADLFADLVRDPDLAGFDAAMTRLGLLAPEKGGRPMDDRIAGVRRLLRRLAIGVAAQLALLLVLLAVGAA
jgi:hypothetical protein